MSGFASIHYLPGSGSDEPLSGASSDGQPLVYVGEPDRPTFLAAEAKREWDRIAPELKKARLLARIDRAALALYCQCWARWVWAERELAKAMATATRREAEAIAAGKEWTGGDGITIPTPSGHMTYSPHWVVANKAMEQVNRYLSNFGMSPASRKQVQAAVQLSLFESEGDEPDATAPKSRGGPEADGGFNAI